MGLSDFRNNSPHIVNGYLFNRFGSGLSGGFYGLFFASLPVLRMAFTAGMTSFNT
jgi:hypothetical protein